jgi:multimeric flavodoxin WrbA
MKEIRNTLSVDDNTLNYFLKVQKQTIQEANNLYKKESGKIKVLGISGSARDEFDYAQEKSNSEALLEESIKECKKLGAETEIIQLRKFNIKSCKACYSTTNTHCHYPCSCYQKGTLEADDMSNILYKKVLEADAIIFATPVNNFKVSSLMSLFIDRCISLDGSLSPANPKQPKDKEFNKKHTKFIESTADQKILGSGFLRRFSGKVGGIIATGHEEGASMAISSLFMTMSHWGMAFPPFSNMYAMSSIENSTDKDKEIVLSKSHVEDAKYLAKNVTLLAKKIRGEKKNWIYDYKVN